MKRTSISVILVLSLLGAPMPVQAANGMTDMMSLMMEMFLWMMRGGSGGFNPYSMGGLGGYGNPMMANSLLGNPVWGNSIAGYPQGFGNMSPYATQGLYSPLVNPGMAPYYNPNTTNSYSYNPYTRQYTAPYNSTYYGNNAAWGAGYQPYNRQAYTNPFYPYRYNLNSRNSNSYRAKPYAHQGEKNNYNNYGPTGHAKGQSAPVVIQPIIVSPTPQPSTMQSATSDTVEPYQYPVVVQPAHTPLAAESVEPAIPDGYAYKDQVLENDSPLYGEWQGINGEYMNLGSSQFHLRSGDTDLQGTYQVKNSILKAEIPNRVEPVYMQYHLNDGYLMFLSEDGQKMLFRRFP